ncbi:MAG: PAS domain S-box protein [Anaerolineales bacterium]|nr:PAS domain S-box protein [Anaerolineales bacterium]
MPIPEMWSTTGLILLLILLVAILYWLIRRSLILPLAKLRARYRQLFDNSLNGIAIHEIVTDEQNRPIDYIFLEVNRAFEELTGLSAEKVIGKKVTDVLPGIEEIPFIEIYGRVTLTGEAVRFEQYSEPLSRHYEIVAFSTTERRFATVFSDTTDRKLAEQELKERSVWLEETVEERTQELREAQEQLNRLEKLAMLGQLAAGVAHELRNPLGVISNAVYYLKNILTTVDEKTCEYLEIIDTEIDHSEKIITDLLDYSHDAVPQREAINLSKLISDVIARYPPPEAVTISTEFDHEVSQVFVDGRQIMQVLANLITNAYQAMPEGGVLGISARRQDGEVHLSIRDTGSGISATNLNKVFEPLFTTKPKGIGLGLAISKTLVEVNGGRIEVASAEHEGTTFTLILPRSNGS